MPVPVGIVDGNLFWRNGFQCVLGEDLEIRQLSLIKCQLRTIDQWQLRNDN